MTVYIDLVLDNGDLVRIEAPSKVEDQLHDSLTNAMKRRDWWIPQQFEGCTAELNGVMLNRVAMSRVVGVL